MTQPATIQERLSRLTPEYRSIIVKTFPAFNDSYGRNGMLFFAKYFAEYPDYKNLWPHFRGVQDSAVIGSEHLRKHALSFMAALQEIVDSIEHNDRLIEITKKIIKRHQKFNVHRYHVEHMVPELLASLKICLGPAMCQETEQAWRALFEFIATVLTTHHI